MRTIQTDLSAGFYVTGGGLRHDAPCYIERQADQDLYKWLRQGQFCYVLTARQMGKSSLMIRTAARLRQAGIGVAVLDLTAVGQNLTPEQWYGGLLAQLGQRLDLEDELFDFWQARSHLGLMQRWLLALREVVLPCYPGRLVIFIDEIDAVRSLAFSADEFFAGIRECYNRRGRDLALEPLTFCLLGVATPADLIRDKRTTPFNVGRCIELNDFTVEEALLLARGLPSAAEDGEQLLKHILYWTGGHPYLTQRLCQALAEGANAYTEDEVDRLCAELFCTRRARERDDNLLFVREQILRSDIDRASLLDLYQQVIRGKPVRDDETNALVSTLRLAGIVRAKEGRLAVRNRIYARVFDQRWVTDNMPDAELRRQRIAYRRGWWRAAIVTGLALALASSLVVLAFIQQQRAEQLRANRRLLYLTQLRLAAEGWEGGNVSLVEDLLKRTRGLDPSEDLRGFEWFHLSWLTQQQFRRLQEEHPVVALAFVPSGQSLLVGTALRTGAPGTHRYLLQRYDWPSDGQRAVEPLSVPSGNNFDLMAFSPDRRYVAVDSPDGTITLCDLHTGQPANFLKGHSQVLSAIVFSPQGDKLLTADLDGEVKLWTTATGREYLTLKRQASYLQWAAFSPDGEWLVTVDGSPQTRLWNVANGQEAAPLTSETSLIAAEFFPDGRRLLTATREGSLQIWDWRAGRKLATLSGHIGHIKAIAFSPNGMMFATGGYDRIVRLWSVETGRELAALKGHGSAVRALAWSVDGRYLATGSTDKSVSVWDVIARQEPLLPAEPITSYLAATFSAQNELLVLGITTDGRAKLWNLSTDRKMIELKDPGEKLLCAVFSADGKWLATGGTDNLVRLWKAETGELVKRLAGHSGFVYAVAFSPDGKLLVSGGADQAMKLWEIETGRALASLSGEIPNSYRAIFSPDGKWLASACRDGRVHLWDLVAGRVRLTLSGHTAVVKAIAFSHDSRLLATGGEDNSVRIWEVITGRELRNLGQADYAQRIAFSPDSKRLVTGNANGAVKLWDLRTWQELITLRGHTDQVTSLTFSFDGTRLASTSNDGTVQLWRTAGGEKNPPH